MRFHKALVRFASEPPAPQVILIRRLPSERPINTSVDRSYLLPSKSQRVQGRVECEPDDESGNQPSNPPSIHLLCQGEGGGFARVVIRLSSDSGAKLWCTCHWERANRSRRCKTTERSTMTSRVTSARGGLSFVIACALSLEGCGGQMAPQESWDSWESTTWHTRWKISQSEMEAKLGRRLDEPAFYHI